MIWASTFEITYEVWGEGGRALCPGRSSGVWERAACIQRALHVAIRDSLGRQHCPLAITPFYFSLRILSYTLYIRGENSTPSSMLSAADAKFFSGHAVEPVARRCADVRHSIAGARTDLSSDA